MKKTVAILALVAFLGGMSAPMFANNNSSLVNTELSKDDPKKKDKKKKKAEKKAEKKTSECTSEKKTSDCAKTCGGAK